MSQKHQSGRGPVQGRGPIKVIFVSLFVGMNLFNISVSLAYSDQDDYLITVKGAKVLAKNEIYKDKLRSANKAEAERLAAKYRSVGLDVTIYQISETSYNVALTNEPSLADRRYIELYESRNNAENMSDPEAMYGLALQKQEDHERRMRRGSQMQDPKKHEVFNAASSSASQHTNEVQARYVQPLHTSDVPVTELSLKNGRKMECYIIQKDEKGIWVEPMGLEGGKMYFSNDEIVQQKKS